jgi:hypothetical protein
MKKIVLKKLPQKFSSITQRITFVPKRRRKLLIRSGGLLIEQHDCVNPAICRGRRCRNVGVPIDDHEYQGYITDHFWIILRTNGLIPAYIHIRVYMNPCITRTPKMVCGRWGELFRILKENYVTEYANLCP